MGKYLVEEVMDYATALGLSYREKWALAVLARDARDETRLTFHHATDEEIVRRAGLEGHAWTLVRASLIRKGVLVVVEPGRRGHGAKYYVPELSQLSRSAQPSSMGAQGEHEMSPMDAQREHESERMSAHAEHTRASIGAHAEHSSGFAPYSNSSFPPPPARDLDMPRPRGASGEGEIEIDSTHMRRAYELMENVQVPGLAIDRSAPGALALATAIAQRLAVGRREADIRAALNRREPSRGAGEPVALQLGRIRKLPLRPPQSSSRPDGNRVADLLRRDERIPSADEVRVRAQFARDALRRGRTDG